MSFCGWCAIGGAHDPPPLLAQGASVGADAERPGNPLVRVHPLRPGWGVALKFTLPYPPSANDYWRHVTIHGKPRVIVTANARSFKAAAALAARAQGARVLKGPVEVAITVYRPRRIGDLDNTQKVLLDALRGVAFEDDSQVVHIEAWRMDDKSNPRAEVIVQALGDGWVP
jgi:Holliday junction resolvase RusA-like endonuclease